MIVDFYGIAPVALAPTAVVLLYAGMYAVLRCAGTLRVGREGWHAEAVRLPRRILIQALWLFALFQLPMRMESALRRRRGGESEAGEPAISEVVVELVSFA